MKLLPLLQNNRMLNRQPAKASQKGAIMVDIDEEKLKSAYVLYCKEVGLKKDSWNSIFDFSATFGFSTLYGAAGMTEEDTKMKVSNRTARSLDWLTGPHAETMAKIFKHKRLSVYGKIKTSIAKVGHFLAFAVITTYQVVRMVTK